MNNQLFPWLCREEQSQPRLWFESPLIQKATEVYKQTISDVLQQNSLTHPREQAFVTWLGRNQSNIDWYTGNREQFKLVNDWILILDDEFYLDDEKAEIDVHDKDRQVWNHKGNSYFTFDWAQTHALAHSRRIPEDWHKYTKFLPGDDVNKLGFLIDVLWLNLWGNLYWLSRVMDAHGHFGYYWSSMAHANKGVSMNFNAHSIFPKAHCRLNNAFSVRCLKPKRT